VPGRDPHRSRRARRRRRRPSGRARRSRAGVGARAAAHRRRAGAARLDPDPGGEMSAPREIYADHAATTRPPAEVVEAMRPYFAERFGNASSVHRRGEAARDAIESTRARVSGLIGASPEEIVFTASGSEANNLALQGAMAVAANGRRRLVVSAI